jgi:hypothetical protein
MDGVLQVITGHAKTGRYISDRQLLFGHMIDRLDFEFFGVTRVLMAPPNWPQLKAKRCLRNPGRFRVSFP